MVTFHDPLLQNHWDNSNSASKKHFGVKEIQVSIACQTSQKGEMIIEKYRYFAKLKTYRYPETVNQFQLIFAKYHTCSKVKVNFSLKSVSLYVSVVS